MMTSNYDCVIEKYLQQTLTDTETPHLSNLPD